MATRSNDAIPVLRRLAEDELGTSLQSNEPIQFVRVLSRPIAIVLTLAAAARDGDGRDWDVTLSGTAHVSNPIQFAKECGLQLASPGAPLTREGLASWLVVRAGAPLRDTIRTAVNDNGFETFRDKHVFTPETWTSRLNDCLSSTGLRVTVERAEWENAELEQQEAERRQAAALERMAREKQQEREAEAREWEAERATEKDRLRLAAEHAEMLRRLAHDQEISEAAKRHQIERLETEHKLAMQELEMKLQQARLKAEREQQEARYKAEQAAIELLLVRAKIEERIAATRATAANQEQLKKAEVEHDAELRRLELEERRDEARQRAQVRRRECELKIDALAEAFKVRQANAELELEQVNQRAEQLRLQHQKRVAELNRELASSTAVGAGGIGVDWTAGVASHVSGFLAYSSGLSSTCGACGKVLQTALDRVGTCEAAGCGSVICNTCWTVHAKRQCQRHIKT
ncbi:MAG: hypothetical protein GX456_06860 [Verrucomicrobia bacterium]|nr:hypothetical protein [Verrucomicrobiota bacterium]